MTDCSEPHKPPVPEYLRQYYHWAYVSPQAIRFWDHSLLIQLILFGQYHRLKNRTRAFLNQSPQVDVLQIACVYGSLSHDLLQDLPAQASLTVLDVVADQLDRVRSKNHSPRLHLVQADSQNIPFSDGRFAKILLFFLLHEQPEAVRRQTIHEALRVLSADGILIIVDYHRPTRLHPLKPIITLVFRFLEPFAHQLWDAPLDNWLHQHFSNLKIQKSLYFGGLYQLLHIRKI